MTTEKTTVRVRYSDGDAVTTTINGDEAAARAYFAIGSTFNLGAGGDDRVVSVVAVDVV